MASFKYEAVNQAGQTVTGVLEAEQETNVIERLRGMGLVVVDITREKKPLLSGDIKLSKMSRGVKLADLSLFSRQLATMLESGIPLTRALYTLGEQVSSAVLAEALTDIARNVEGGSNLSDSLNRYPAIFSPLYVSMVNAGEIGGNLEVTLSRLANQLQREKELRDNIKSATFYPIAVISFAVLVMFGMLFFIVPVFINMFPEGTALPLPTRIIVGLSDAMRRFWFIIIPGLIGLYMAIRYYFNSPAGKKRLDPLKLRLPVFGSLIQKTVVARFARTFSTLVSSGVNVIQALNAAGAAAGNTVVIEAVQEAGQKIQEGKNLSTPIKDSGVFPPMVTQMISVGEETGELPEMLDKVADFYEEEVATMTKGLTALIEPVMLVVVGVLVGGILVALYLPMFSVITQLG
jgi:type IV pilus assembly protein PilC